MEDGQIWNKEQGRVEFSDPQKELESRKAAMDDSIEMQKIHSNFGIVGKVGITYLGLRAIGNLMGMGPELNPNELSVLDYIGVMSAYIGGSFLLAGQLLKFDEREHRKDYESYLEKMSDSAI